MFNSSELQRGGLGVENMCSHLRTEPRIQCVCAPRRAIHHAHNKGLFAWRWKFMVALLCPNNSARRVSGWQPLPKTAALLSIKKHLHMFNFRCDQQDSYRLLSNKISGSTSMGGCMMNGEQGGFLSFYLKKTKRKARCLSVEKHELFYTLLIWKMCRQKNKNLWWIKIWYICVHRVRSQIHINSSSWPQCEWEAAGRWSAAGGWQTVKWHMTSSVIERRETWWGNVRYARGDWSRRNEELLISQSYLWKISTAIGFL